MSRRAPPARRLPNIKLEAHQQTDIKPEPIQTPPPESRLLALPTELRLKVYEHLFTNSLIHVSVRNRLTHPSNPRPDFPRLIFTPSTTNSPDANTKDKYVHYIRSPTLGILSTCQSIRNEALPECYETATFLISGSAGNNPQLAAEWLGSLSLREKQSLTAVRLTIYRCLAPPSLLKSSPGREGRCEQALMADRRAKGVGQGVVKVTWRDERIGERRSRV